MPRVTESVYAGQALSQTHWAHLPLYLWCQSDAEPLIDGLNCRSLACIGFWMKPYEGVPLKVHAVHHCTVQWLVSSLCTRLSAERAYMLQKNKGARVLQLRANSFVSGVLCPRMSACIFSLPTNIHISISVYMIKPHKYIYFISSLVGQMQYSINIMLFTA